MKIGPYKINQVHQGDALECLKLLPDDCIQCVVTSPPYWGMRDYDVEGQLGLEPTIAGHIEKIVEIFREVKRVIRPDGTLWLNYGDTYIGSGRGGDPGKNSTLSGTWRAHQESKNALKVHRGKHSPLKPKQLAGLPWRIALALQDDGWWLRSDIIWHKPNVLPEACRDRPVKSHEYIFLLTKRAKYFYDNEAIKELASKDSHDRGTGVHAKAETASKMIRGNKSFCGKISKAVSHRNKRTVWTIPTAPFRGAHFATFPPALVETCILAGTSERGACPVCGAPWVRIVERDEKISRETTSKTPPGQSSHSALSKNRMDVSPETKTIGWRPTCKCVDDFERNFSPHQPLEPTARSIVLDPFAGSGTTGEVAIKLGRDFIGFELNTEYSEKFANPRLEAAKQGLTLKELKSGQRGLFTGNGN